MFWLYILKNEETGRYYIGSTGDLNQRLSQHLIGKTRTTRVLKTDKLVYSEKFETKSEALKKRESLKVIKVKSILNG